MSDRTLRCGSHEEFDEEVRVGRGRQMGKTAKRKRSAKTKKLKFKKGEGQKFKRLAKRARKAGLLVSRDTYIRYFRDPPDDALKSERVKKKKVKKKKPSAR